MAKIYNLDHAAGAPLDKNARKAVLGLINNPLYNTDSSYEPAVKLRRQLSDFKSKLAKLIGTKSPNIFITKGSSDATDMLFELISSSKNSTDIVTTNIEHKSLLDNVELFPKNKILEVDQTGLIDLEKIREFIDDKTILVSIQYVNNETGQVLPIKEISKIVKDIKGERIKKGSALPIFFHTDASQAAITQDLQIPRLGVDAMSLNGSKFGALPNTGILYLSADILRWLENNNIQTPSSKENPLAVVSLYYSLKHSIEKKNTELKRLNQLAQTFWQEFSRLIPEAELTPKNLKICKKHSPHILNIYIPNVSGERLVILAGLNNVLISTGAACSASKDIPSHVLKAIGLNNEEIQSSIRVSLGSDNKSEKELKEAAKILAKLCKNKSVKISK